MALVGMLPYGVVSSWSIFSLRKSGIYCKRKRDWRLFEVGGTSFVWGFQQFLNINGTKPRINYYRQSYYFAIWNINYSHLAIRRPFVAAVLCLPWYSVIWIEQDWGLSHYKLHKNYLMIENAIITFSKAFLDTLILSTLENLKHNEYIVAHTHSAAFLSMNFLSHYDDQLPFWQLHINIVEVVAWVLCSILEIKTTVL